MDTFDDFIFAGVEFAHANNDYAHLKRELRIARQEGDEALIENLSEQVACAKADLDEMKKQLLGAACALTGDEDESNDDKEDE